MKQKRTKEQKKMKRTVIILCLTWIGTAFSSFLFCFPFWERTYSAIVQRDVIQGYEGKIASYSDETIAEMEKEAQDYNAKIYQQQQINPFTYQEEDKSDTEYESILEGQIGILDVPEYDIYLPIMHGTSNDTLNNNAGHMYGSSFPVEGDNVLSVIAGHNGLVTSKLFTDITEMKKGDVFYIHVLGKILEYEVMDDSDIITTLPEDEYKYLQIKEGKNQVALYTCYPYGINTHRRIVIGTFTGEVNYDTFGTENANKFSIDDIGLFAKFAGLTLLPIVITGYGVYNIVVTIKKYRVYMANSQTIDLE